MSELVHTSTPDVTQQAIIDAFLECGDAFNQFEHLLELAAKLPELPESKMRAEALVKGCQSQVWLYPSWDAGDGAAQASPRLHLVGDSDTLMVRGVIYILALMFEGRTPEEVLGCSLRFIEETELASIFDAKRKTGVASIMDVIRSSARTQLGDTTDPSAPTEEEQATMPTLKTQLEAADAHASEIVEELRKPGVTEGDFIHLVEEFVRCKFFLTPEECTTDNLLDLAEISVEKLLRVSDRSVRLAQGSTTCTNQSSTDIKKVLLSLTLQRALGVKFTPEESAELETVTQLSHALYNRCRNASC